MKLARKKETKLKAKVTFNNGSIKNKNPKAMWVSLLFDFDGTGV
jgi:hypothetical protein